MSAAQPMWRDLPGIEDLAAILHKELPDGLPSLVGVTPAAYDVTTGDAFVAAGLVGSKAEMRRLLKQNARFSIGGKRVEQVTDRVAPYPSWRGYWVLFRSKNLARCVQLKTHDELIQMPW